MADHDPQPNTAAPQVLRETLDLYWEHGSDFGSQVASAAEEALQAYEDLLGSIWLYIKWQYVTKQLTTVQKEMFADAVDASSRRLNEDDEGWTPVAERWWQD